MSWEGTAAPAPRTPWSPAPPPGSRPPSATNRPQSAGSIRRQRPQSAPMDGRIGNRPPSLNASSTLTPTAMLMSPTSNSAAANPGRRVVAADLGLASQRVLTLPSHVGTCNMGEKCCWRWLAHSVLKEATWLKKDLDSVREERAQQCTNERFKIDHNAEAFAELRGAHAEKQRELGVVSAEVADLRRELGAMRTAHVYKAARTDELERELARVEEARRVAAEREAAATRRADEAERELARALAVEKELSQSLLAKEDWKTKAIADQRELQAEYDQLKQAADEAAAKLARKKQKARKNEVRKRPQSAGLRQA